MVLFSKYILLAVIPAPITIMQSPINLNCIGVGKKYLKIINFIIKILGLCVVFRAAEWSARTYQKPAT